MVRLRWRQVGWLLLPTGVSGCGRVGHSGNSRSQLQGRGGWEEGWVPKGSRDWWMARSLRGHAEGEGLVEVQGSGWSRRSSKEVCWELGLLGRQDGDAETHAAMEGERTERTSVG